MPSPFIERSSLKSSTAATADEQFRHRRKPYKPVIFSDPILCPHDVAQQFAPRMTTSQARWVGRAEKVYSGASEEHLARADETRNRRAVITRIVCLSKRRKAV